MEIRLTDKYFGDADALERFARETLQEIKNIEDKGKEKSKEPDRFLGDVFPGLNNIQILFEHFIKTIEWEKKKIVFDGMNEVKNERRRRISRN